MALLGQLLDFSPTTVMTGSGLADRTWIRCTWAGSSRRILFFDGMTCCREKRRTKQVGTLDWEHEDIKRNNKKMKNKRQEVIFAIFPPDEQDDGVTENWNTKAGSAISELMNRVTMIWSHGHGMLICYWLLQAAATSVTHWFWVTCQYAMLAAARVWAFAVVWENRLSCSRSC